VGGKLPGQSHERNEVWAHGTSYTHITKRSCHGSETVSIVVASDPVGFYFPGDAKVQKLNLMIEVDANVGWLDVSVNYPVAMEVFQSLRYAEGHIKPLGQELALSGHEVHVARVDAADGGSTTVTAR